MGAPMFRRALEKEAECVGHGRVAGGCLGSGAASSPKYWGRREPIASGTYFRDPAQTTRREVTTPASPLSAALRAAGQAATQRWTGRPVGNRTEDSGPVLLAARRVVSLAADVSVMTRKLLK